MAMERRTPLQVRFYRGPSGRQPVREWLSSLSKVQRYAIGVDIWKVQSQWPIGMPHVRPLGHGLYELRIGMTDGIARLLFIVDGEMLVLFHGFTKKTQKIPPGELDLAEKRRRDYEQNKEK
jgi:phage-related protein